MKYFAFALLLAACGRETTNTKQTVSPTPLPIPVDVLPPILSKAVETQNAKRLNSKTTTVTLPDGTILTHEYCKTLRGDAKSDCTALLHDIAFCAKEADEPRAKCEALSISDYLELTNEDDDDEDDDTEEYPSLPG